MEYIIVDADASLFSDQIYLLPSASTVEAIKQVHSRNLIEQTLWERIYQIYGPRQTMHLIKKFEKEDRPRDRLEVNAVGYDELDPKLFFLTKIYRKQENIVKSYVRGSNPLVEVKGSDIFNYANNLKKLADPKNYQYAKSGKPILNQKYYDHSLIDGDGVKYSKDLHGFRSFRINPETVTAESEENDSTVICLYTRSKDFRLVLANIGRHDEVYRAMSADEYKRQIITPKISMFITFTELCKRFGNMSNEKVMRLLADSGFLERKGEKYSLTEKGKANTLFSQDDGEYRWNMFIVDEILKKNKIV